MKNILLTLSAAVVLLAACKSEKKNALDIDKSIVFTDTSALKQGNYSTDVATQGNNAPVAAPEEKAPEEKPQIRTITKVIHVKDKPDPVVQATPPSAPPVVTPTTPAAEAPAPVATAPSAGTGTALPGTTTTPAEAKKKEGWSGAAKGAAIGGIGGAVAGAVIGKGGKGAIIGGVVGAAGGYILGRKADKKSGRADLIQP